VIGIPHRHRKGRANKRQLIAAMITAAFTLFAGLLTAYQGDPARLFEGGWDKDSGVMASAALAILVLLVGAAIVAHRKGEDADKSERSAMDELACLDRQVDAWVKEHLHLGPVSVIVPSLLLAALIAGAVASYVTGFVPRRLEAWQWWTGLVVIGTAILVMLIVTLRDMDD
jgi:hypothetical protein